MGGRFGYFKIKVTGHPRANTRGYVMEHIVVAEMVLGKPLPLGAVVHHRNGNKKDNEPDNLVICEDEAYHQILHRRLRAYRATGSANVRRCRYCKHWGTDVVLSTGGDVVYHRDCAAKKRREERSAKAYSR